MVMSQGTYTFLACFAGFWLVWALIVMVCCFCSFVQRKLKRRREQRLREHCLRALEMEPLECAAAAGYPPARETPQFCPVPQMISPQVPIAHTIPQANWTPPQVPAVPVDSELCGKPPCYEEAVLMEDPPPPYSEVLADPRGGTYTKPAPRCSRDHQESETRKMAPPMTVFPERGYSSLIRLPSARRWDSLGHLLSTMDLNHNNLPAEPQASAIATMPREGRTHTDLGLRSLRGLDHNYGLPTAFPLLGRSTAV
ncbi:proline-rich protein 7 [Astyanax mexicanus]|uniref:Proline rich 7, synaptic n=1 Tax=Astyanax mexicanus TaxID=7994 RepID=A0A8B9JD26_ASTMX|nr:proline-rich protein 7 [Astyanax mexicanus]KAG9265909.1 proline-rich protein 7 [Astyanax mexicanus]